MSATDTVELESLKSRLKSTWMAGNYDYFSRFMESSAAEFLARLPLGPGDHVLDVACGSGQLALLAARKGARVTGVDIATNSTLQLAAPQLDECLAQRHLVGLRKGGERAIGRTPRVRRMR